MECAFYHILHTPLDAAVFQLLDKIYKTNQPCLVTTDSEQRAKHLDSYLWQADPASFLPHGTPPDINAAQQPIWITASTDNPNNATVWLGIEVFDHPALPHMQKALILFNGQDDESVQKARTAWKSFKQQQINCTYYQQQAGGGWKKQ
jgi:DNA polymerase III subunit chi